MCLSEDVEGSRDVGEGALGLVQCWLIVSHVEEQVQYHFFLFSFFKCLLYFFCFPVLTLERL